MPGLFHFCSSVPTVPNLIRLTSFPRLGAHVPPCQGAHTPLAVEVRLPCRVRGVGRTSSREGMTGKLGCQRDGVDAGDVRW